MSPQYFRCILVRKTEWAILLFKYVLVASIDELAFHDLDKDKIDDIFPRNRSDDRDSFKEKYKDYLVKKMENEDESLETMNAVPVEQPLMSVAAEPPKEHILSMNLEKDNLIDDTSMDEDITYGRTNGVEIIPSNATIKKVLTIQDSYTNSKLLYTEMF